MTVTIRGIEFQSNLDNPMGLAFHDLSHRFGFQSPNWPYFQDVQIERLHYMAKSGVLSQRITTTMHNTTHIDAPAHVVAGTPFIDEVPLPHFFGTGLVVPVPKQRWEQITADDLERACGHAVRPYDVIVINTGWHHKYEDNDEYFAYCPGLVPSAADWMIDHQVKVVGHDTQANDHPLATAIGPHRNGPLLPHLAREYVAWSGGRTPGASPPATFHRQVRPAATRFTASTSACASAARFSSNRAAGTGSEMAYTAPIRSLKAAPTALMPTECSSRS